MDGVYIGMACTVAQTNPDPLNLGNEILWAVGEVR